MADVHKMLSQIFLLFLIVVSLSTAQNQTEDPDPHVKRLPPHSFRYRRIFNPDEQANIEQYPFMASVLMNKLHWCGGVIVHRDKVLTAAHCLQLHYNNHFFMNEYIKMLTVRVGSSNSTGGGVVIEVKYIDFHPNYKPSTLEFNAVMLTLSKNLNFGSIPPVGPIPLAEGNVINKDNIVFLGWGTVLGGSNDISKQELLQKVELPVYNKNDCQDIYGTELVTQMNFCAGYLTKIKNVCNHDAGGPAIMNGALVGILSFSAKRCDLEDRPAVFQAISPIATWIDSFIKESKE